MSLLISMLIVIYVVTYQSAHKKVGQSKLHTHTFILSVVITLIMSIQLFFFVKPPDVNYWTMGWYGQIKFLNEQYRMRGNPNQIPLPGEN